MRVAASVTSLSWIPREAVSGVTALPFELGIAHYDDPPPETLGDLDELRRADGFRFANRLRAWVEVEGGRVVSYGQEGGGLMGATSVRIGPRTMTFAAVAFPELRPAPVVGDGWVRFAQTAGGRTGAPAPRRIKRRPYVQYTAPVAWTTLHLTIRTDGSTQAGLAGASPFPRHWIYDDSGELIGQSGVIDFARWSREVSGPHTPWGDEDSPAMMAAVASTCELQLSSLLTAAGTPAPRRTLAQGEVLVRQGEPGAELFVLLDGVLTVEVDGEPVAEVGPGAVLGEQALLRQGARMATLRARTPARVVVVPGDRVDSADLAAVSRSHGVPVAPLAAGQ